MRQQQAIGALLICLFIAIITSAVIIVPRCTHEPENNEMTFSIDTLLADSLEQQWQAAHPHYQSKYPRYPKRHSSDTVQIRMHRFDPNTEDSIALLQVGLKPYQVHSILKYRATGARYRQPEDLRKMYVIPDSLYDILAPWITITPDSIDTILAAQPRWHEKRDTILDLNLADTSSLQFLHGIGPVKARCIIKYRQRLGGFLSVDQLAEVEDIPFDSIRDYLVVDTLIIRPIRLNYPSLRQMTNHPYIGYEKAKQIDELRHRRTIRSEQDLLQRGIFTEDELAKLRPYLSFEK